MIIYVLMGRALYCPQGSKPSQNLCPMPLKYHVFISLALGQLVESVKSSSLCFAGKSLKCGFHLKPETNGSRCERELGPVRMEEGSCKEALP